MCESLVCGSHYGLHSIFKHTNELYYLRNRKRVACVYGVIMHAGNAGPWLER